MFWLTERECEAKCSGSQNENVRLNVLAQRARMWGRMFWHIEHQMIPCTQTHRAPKLGQGLSLVASFASPETKHTFRKRVDHAILTVFVYRIAILRVVG
jgi:hypothetical protein